MKKALLIAVALILAVGFLACQDEFGAIRNTGETKIIEAPDAGSSPYFPYKEGKTWNYETITNGEIDYPDDSPMEDTSWTDTFTYVSEVIRETQLTGSNPLPVWELKYTYIWDDMNPEVYYDYAHIEPDSAYFYDKRDDSEPWYTFPSEPELGDEWTIEIETVIIDSIIGTDTFTTTVTFRTDYEVVADGETANGYEDCLKIEAIPENYADYDSYERFEYWAKDVGNVMATTNYTLGIPDVYTMTFEAETRLIKGPGIPE